MKVVSLNPDRTANVLSFAELTERAGFAVDKYNCAMAVTNSDYNAHVGGLTSFASSDSIGVKSEGQGSTARVSYAVTCWRQ